MTRRDFLPLYLLFCLLLICNIGLWRHTHHLIARWTNMPPAPGKAGVIAFGLSDSEFSYRTIGLMIQNIGNSDGDYKPLKDYDYQHVGQWLVLSDRLDPISDFMPTIAAFYFGGTQNPSELPPVVDYLEKQGKEEYAHKWYWLAQAVYLARFREHDMARSLQLANELAAEWKPGEPLWIKEMPALINTASGDKATAYGIMLGILRDEAGKVPQPELNSTIIFICQRILDPTAAAMNQLCIANAALLK